MSQESLSLLQHKKRIMRSVWRLGFVNDITIASEIWFNDDGTIGGAENIAEKFWKVTESALYLIDRDGNSLIFNLRGNETDNSVLYACHWSDANAKVSLIQTPLDALNEYEIERISFRKLNNIRPISTETPDSTAVITMVYNERIFLPLWIKYYGKQFGNKNLFVLDHGSTDGSTDNISANRICIPRFKFDDKRRARMISDLHSSLLKCYDTVIVTDVDEILVPRPTVYKSLSTYVSTRKTAITRCVGVNVMPAHVDNPKLDYNKPLLRQRQFGFLSGWYYKPLIASIPAHWDPGFHDCAEVSTLDTDLWMFHLKFIDYHHLAHDDKQQRIQFLGGDFSRNENFLKGRRELLENNKFLDEYDLKKWFTWNEASPLARIPDEFLDSI